MRDILSANQAACVIGCGPQEVRHRLRNGRWKFGKAFSPKETGMSQWQYEIHKRQLANFLEIGLDEVDRRLEEAQ